MPLDHLRDADREDLIHYAARMEWILEEIVRWPTPETAYVKKELETIRKRLKEQTRKARLRRP